MNYDNPAMISFSMSKDGISAHSTVSLRDYFAAAALTGLLANPPEEFEAASDAYQIADAMLAARGAK